MRKYFFTSMFCLCLSLAFSQEELLFNLTDTNRPPFLGLPAITPELDIIVRDNSKVMLSWKVTTDRNGFFSIERSCNGKEFETIAVLKQTSGPLKMDWVDEQPVRGKNQYRIGCSTADGKLIYSGVVTAQVSGNISFRFYPNPADNVLIVRSEQAVDLTIVDGNGKMRISQNQLAGLQMLNISSLEQGVYILHIYNRQLNTHTQEKLVKK